MTTPPTYLVTGAGGGVGGVGPMVVNGLLGRLKERLQLLLGN